METLEFLRRVLPSEGYYVITVINDGSPPQQGFFGTVEELATACQTADATGNNTYYAYSSFTTNRNRKQENVAYTRVVAMDVDCGEDKPYETHIHGARALGDFISKFKLPKPLVVNSGRGLHAYWVLDRDLTPHEWQPIADKMKAMALDSGFEIDPAITGDSARVLRPTQTHNPKNGALVDVLMDADVVEVQTLQNLLQVAQHTPQTQTPPPAPATGFGKYRASKIQGSLDSEFPPRDPATIIEKCQQVRWAVEHQEKVSEPMWYALMGVAAYCIDPEETAKAWSNQYSGYSEQETLKKLNQWQKATTGPATCKKFQEAKPKGCANCPLQGKIKSPATIGARYEAVEAVPPQELPVELPPALTLPGIFKRAKSPKGHNIIVQTIDGTEVEVFPYDIYPVGYGRDEGLGYETVRYKWNRPHVGWQDLQFRQAYLTGGTREFSTALADQGIVLGFQKQIDTVQFMLRSYMDELRSIKTMTNLHGTMGWKEDNSHFVVGNRLYKHENGQAEREDVAVAAGTQRQAAEYYKTQGSADVWREGTALFDAIPEYGFALGVSLAAPLVQFTGLKGVVLSLVGKTGSGKTLCQLIQQSVWGNPNELHFNAEYTQAALFGRLGFYANLPMSVDETTLMRDEDVGRFVMWVTQGRDRARLDRDANERDAKRWATTVTVSTNKSMVAKLTSSGHETGAQMARMVELNMPYRSCFLKGTDFGHRVHDIFCENYGWAGDAIMMEYMRIGPEGLKARIKEHTATFEEKYDVHFAGTERFWKMLFVLTSLTLEIAKEIGLIKFDPVTVVTRALEDVSPMRRSMEDSEFDAFDLVTEYLRKFSSEVITVMHTDGGVSSMDTTRHPPKEVRARIDLYRKSAVEEFDRGAVMIVSRPFKEWLASEGHDMRAVRKEIAGNGADATPASRRFWFGKDTALKYGQLYCTGVLLTHERMAGFMADQQQSAEELTFGQLGVIDGGASD